jgi:hypothetical protein
VRTLVDKGATALAELRAGSYSPRPWGFWSQYNGPSTSLGTVAVEEGASRPGRHPWPEPVRRMFRPLVAAAARPDFDPDAVADLAGLALDRPDTPDLAPLRDLFTATRRGRHEAADWTGDDHTRRATLRILARSVQLRPDAATWSDALRECVARGDAVRSDPVPAAEERALAWCGVLLRHHSVGAWRYLWACLVEEVRAAGGSATRADRYAGVSAAVPATEVRRFLAGCPATTDAAGDTLPAEEQVIGERPPLESDLAVLLMGGRRLDELTGRSLAGSSAGARAAEGSSSARGGSPSGIASTATGRSPSRPGRSWTTCWRSRGASRCASSGWRRTGG